MPSITFRTWPGVLIALGIAILGLFIYKDYGIAWDEGTMRRVGEVNLQFIRTGDEALFKDFRDIDHGAAFEVPLKWGEEALGITDRGGIHRFRNLVCFLFYTIGIWCAYRLALRIFKKQWLALLAAVILVLQPRIFAHAFFNCKDVPFMTAVLIALHAIGAAFERQRLIYFLLAGAACGYATDVRIMGALPAVCAGALMLRDVLFAKGHSERKRGWLAFAAFAIAGLATLYACWPALWGQPFEGLRNSFRSMARYGWGGWLVFNGKGYKGAELPLWYAPEWIAISTPIVWVLLGIAGVFAAARKLLSLRRVPLTTVRQKMLVLCAISAIVPVVLVIGLHSTLYDDWRHLYFIYPPAVMLAVYGAEQLTAQRPGQRIVMALCMIEAAVTMGLMVYFHPYENVYFNELVPASVEYRRHHFDYEYWGTSFGDGLRHILREDRRDSIRVVQSLAPVKDNGDALPDSLKRRIRWTGGRREQGAYLLTNYRNDEEDPPYPKVWEIRRGGSAVMTIYRVDTTYKPTGPRWRTPAPQY